MHNRNWIAKFVCQSIVAEEEEQEWEKEDDEAEAEAEPDGVEYRLRTGQIRGVTAAAKCATFMPMSQPKPQSESQSQPEEIAQFGGENVKYSEMPRPRRGRGQEDERTTTTTRRDDDDDCHYNRRQQQQWCAGKCARTHIYTQTHTLTHTQAVRDFNMRVSLAASCTEKVSQNTVARKCDIKLATCLSATK